MNQRQLLGFSALALVGIAVLLFLDFQSLRLTLLVLGTLPFALIGGVAHGSHRLNGGLGLYWNNAEAGNQQKRGDNFCSLSSHKDKGAVRPH